MKNIYKFLLDSYKLICKIVLTPLLKFEQKYPSFPSINERTIEYNFAFRKLAKYYPENILDVGTGISSWPHILANCGYNVKAIDLIEGYWNGTYFNRHFKVINDNVITPKTINEKYSMVMCISVIEHIPEHTAAVKSMLNMLKDGGHLLITCPYNENIYHPNIYKHPDFKTKLTLKYITQVYSRKEINGWLENSDCEIIEQEYYQIFDKELWSLGNMIIPAKKVENTELHNLTCLLIRKS